MRGDGTDWGEGRATGSPPASITLTMRQGPNPGQRFTIHKDNVTVGRLPGNDISIPDTQVSRHHANITWENGQWVIRDVGSANGTAVNGMPITDAQPLRDGDVVALGEVVMTFQGSAAMSADPTSDEPFVRPLDDPMFPPPRSPLHSGGTLVMPGPIEEQAGTNIWPVLIGIGLALFFALIVVVAVLYIVLSQNQTPPEIKVQQPANGQEARAGEPMLILASASGKGITRAELWIDGTLNATIPSNSPDGQPVLFVQQSWTPNAGGPHVLTLRAFNTAGKSSASQQVSVNVTEPKVSLAQPTPTPALTATPQPLVVVASPTSVVLDAPTALNCVNDAAFVADVTVPDNTVFHSGQRIDKTWRVRNSGSCPWNDGYRLIFISGNKMGAPDNQPVVATAPGGTTDVTVSMYAPGAPGVYTGLWRMVDAAGQPFGQSFTVVIQIPSPYTPTPAVTPTSTPLPGPLVNLTVDRDQVNAGECTVLHGTVEGVSAAWLDGDAVVGGSKDKQVCPCDNTTYVLDSALANGDHVQRKVTVKVNGSCTANKADLTIRDLSADPDNQQKGQSIHFKMRIKNQGGVKAKDFKVVWWPKGSDHGGRQTLNNEMTLDAGQSEWIEWDYTYADSGDYEAEMRADYNGDIDEADKSNNSDTISIEIHS